MTISELLAPIAPPIREDSGGVLRVGRTRVSLDSVLAAYNEGAGADEIVVRFPSLTLGEIRAVLGFYHQKREELDGYLMRAEAEEDRLQEETELRFPKGEIRERILARRTARLRQTG